MAFLQQKASTARVAPDQDDERVLEALVGFDTVSQSTLLLKKKKEMHQVDDRLDDAKDDYRRRGDACEARRAEFEVRQVEMRSQVARFEKFVQENDAKRSRAEAKTRGETRMFLQKVEDQKRGDAELERLLTEKEAQSLKLTKLQQHRAYLEACVDAAGEDTDEVSDLLVRHTALKAANEDLVGQVQSGEKNVDGMRSDLDALNLSSESNNLSRSRAVTTQRSSLEGVRASRKTREEGKEAAEDRAKDATREEAQAVMATRNLYQRCVSTQRGMKIEGVSFGDWEQLDGATRLKRLNDALELIGDRVSDLTAIQKERAEEEKEKTRAAETGPRKLY
jgi:hypothetical protein